MLKEGQLGNVLEVYEDKPINFDAWDIDIFYTQKMERAKLAKAPELVENGSLKAVVRFVFRYHKSVIQQDMTVFRVPEILISSPVWTGRKRTDC